MNEFNGVEEGCELKGEDSGFVHKLYLNNLLPVRSCGSLTVFRSGIKLYLLCFDRFRHRSYLKEGREGGEFDVNRIQVSIGKEPPPLTPSQCV